MTINTQNAPNICPICDGELFEHERDYCEDCRDSGDLEDVLSTALEKTNG